MKQLLRNLVGPRILNAWRMRGKRPVATAEEVFTAYYQNNHWADDESVSGPGSSSKETQRVRELLPRLFREFDIRTFLDVPCGDFAWMQHVPLDGIDYTGADIVEPLIVQNQARYGAPNRRFVHCDLIKGPVPTADLVMCRDCLFHLSLEDAQAAISNIRASRSTYLLTTTHPGTPENLPILTGGYRPLDLQRYPFNFPEPLQLAFERSDAGFADTNKALGLWCIDQLR